MSFPFEIKPVDEELNKKLLEDFPGERTGFVQVGEKKWFFASRFQEEAAGYYNLELRKDDVWVVTYPRSGTTVTQELVWLLNNNLDYEAARKSQLLQRFPFLEVNSFMHRTLIEEITEQNPDNKGVEIIMNELKRPGYEKVVALASPRHIKSHLPLSLLPPSLLDKCKVVYVARNPKDVAVSYYHHNKLITIHGFHKDFPTYWKYFKEDLLLYSPYWPHVIEAWNHRNHPNMLFFFYEELIEDMPGTIKKIADFLGKKILPDEVEQLVNHLRIDNFRKNPSMNFDPAFKGMLKEGEENFYRKGIIGDSKGYFTPEMDEEANKWIAENLQHTDLEFPKSCNITKKL